MIDLEIKMKIFDLHKASESVVLTKEDSKLLQSTILKDQKGLSDPVKPSTLIK